MAVGKTVKVSDKPAFLEGYEGISEREVPRPSGGPNTPPLTL